MPGEGRRGENSCVPFVDVDEQRRLFRGYLWPSKLQIKTVIVHSFARDRSVSSESRKSVYGARYRPSYSLLNPRTLPYIYICIYIYFGLDSNNAGFDLARCMCALEKLHKLEEWILAKKSVRFC